MDKLGLYNMSLLELGERRLASLSEDRPVRRDLDVVWDGGWVRHCLAQGFWNFAMEIAAITYSPSVQPTDGRHAFDKPPDWVRTFMVSNDERFANKLFRYDDKGSYWLADADTIYANYVSSDATLGGDLSLWTMNFTLYAAKYGAARVCRAVTGSGRTKDEIEADANGWLVTAKSTDAMDEEQKFPPLGSWSRARLRNGSGERGSITRLIG